MKYFLIAGEASGDLHASNLMREIKKTDHKAKFTFLGGDLMASEGGKCVKHYREMAFMGFLPVLLNLRKIFRNLSECKLAIEEFKPDVVILIDYPGFNLRVAKYVKTTTQIPVIYYIPPKIWAWKERRIEDIKKYVDKVLTIFPFETSFYQKHNYSVDYVGNPSVDSVYNRPLQQQSFESFCTKNTLYPKPVIAVLPGSRQQEIKTCLPRMVEAATLFSDYQVLIAGAPGIETAFYQKVLPGLKVPVIFGQTYELLQHADAAIVNSGTATLETALIGAPEVVVYHVPFGKLGYWAKEHFLKVKYISLVNLIAEKEAVKELIAHKFSVSQLQFELENLLKNNSYIDAMRQEYRKIADELGSAGTAKNAASKIYEYTKSRNLGES